MLRTMQTPDGYLLALHVQPFSELKFPVMLHVQYLLTGFFFFLAKSKERRVLTASLTAKYLSMYD